MSDNPNRDSGYLNVNAPSKRQKGRSATLLKLLAVLGIIVIAIAMMLPAVRTAREPARRNQCRSQLEQIALALKRYAEVHGALPPAYTTDASGKPLHSWRTLILPFMEEQQLYNAIDLTKPWNDPVNAAAFNTNLAVYQCPSAPWEIDNRTTYLAVVAPNSCIQATEPRKLSDVTDDPSQTLMVIEVDEEHAVPWMSPVDANEDVVLDLASPKSRTPHPGGVQAAFVDGSVYFLADGIPATIRRTLISIAGNDNVTAESAD
jgi:prepilin-type processing-associated H-X9-DG protein